MLERSESKVIEVYTAEIPEFIRDAIAVAIDEGRKNQHSCEAMKVSAGLHEKNFSNSEKFVYSIKKNSDGLWLLTTEWHVQLTGITYCPFCGTRL